MSHNNWSDKKKWIMGILGAFIMLIISFFFNKYSNGSPDVSKNEESNIFTNKSPIQIFENFNNTRPFQQSNIVDSYKGLYVNWELKLEKISLNGHDASIYFSTTGERGVIACLNVDLPLNPGLKVMDKGELILIEGKITDLDEISIELDKCSFTIMKQNTNGVTHYE